MPQKLDAGLKSSQTFLHLLKTGRDSSFYSTKGLLLFLKHLRSRTEAPADGG